jgi:hypothetical protein
MHQDKDEKVNQPVVSLSVGDTGRFRFGNTHDRGKPHTDVDLVSGDAFVFGGPSRFAYHGVPATYPGTADSATGRPRGRINITMRVTGMARPTKWRPAWATPRPAATGPNTTPSWACPCTTRPRGSDAGRGGKATSHTITFGG